MACNVPCAGLLQPSAQPLGLGSLACDVDHTCQTSFSLMPGPLLPRAHGEAKLDAKIHSWVGARNSYQVGLLGAGGETSQAPLHRTFCAPLCEHMYTMASSSGYRPQQSHLRFLLCQMGNPCDTTPIRKSTSSPGSLPDWATLLALASGHWDLSDTVTLQMLMSA